MKILEDIALEPCLY